jgi:hypothetical protein
VTKRYDFVLLFDVQDGKPTTTGRIETAATR